MLTEQQKELLSAYLAVRAENPVRPQAVRRLFSAYNTIGFGRKEIATSCSGCVRRVVARTEAYLTSIGADLKPGDSSIENLHQ